MLALRIFFWLGLNKFWQWFSFGPVSCFKSLEMNGDMDLIEVFVECFELYEELFFFTCSGA